MERSASSVRNPSEEHRRAANAYLIWPLAAANMIREGNAETIWGRLHARQALVFGVLISLMFVIILSLPLIAVVALPALSTASTITVYGGGLILDAVFAIAFALLAGRFAARAARGELFSIPVVTPIVDRLFRMKSP